MLGEEKGFRPQRAVEREPPGCECLHAGQYLGRYLTGDVWHRCGTFRGGVLLWAPWYCVVRPIAIVSLAIPAGRSTAGHRNVGATVFPLPQVGWLINASLVFAFCGRTVVGFFLLFPLRNPSAAGSNRHVAIPNAKMRL